MASSVHEDPLGGALLSSEGMGEEWWEARGRVWEALGFILTSVLGPLPLTADW